MRFLIVGCPRSGTGYTAQLLRAAGIRCGHEQVYGPAQALGAHPDWGTWQADSSWLAVPCLPVADAPAVLLVRHPLDAVKSMVDIGLFIDSRTDRFVRVIRHHAPHVWDEPTEQDRALAMWLHWTTRAAAHAVHAVRLEAMSATVLAGLLKAVGAPATGAGPAVVAMQGRPRYNTKSAEKARLRRNYITGWDKHRPDLAAQARELAMHLGYKDRL